MAFPRRDRNLPDDVPEELVVEKHCEYLEHYGETIDAFEFSFGEYLRISGMYWSVTCLDLLSCLETSQRFRRDLVISFVKTCQKSCGGFAPFPNHDASLLHTLSALQILATFDALGEIDGEKVVEFVVGLQQKNGSFFGDFSGEIDTRFSMCGLASLALLGALDRCDTEKALDFIQKCKNFDGGFGTSPGSQSHAAMVYCCLGSLAILNRLDIVDADRLGLWLAKRQMPSGGLNGRPEKLPDVCYSWWVLASLAMIGRLDWIDGEKLKKFILASQDVEVGGIADCPGNHADPFHTVFGIAGLSLLASYVPEPEKISSVFLKKVNPVFCMSQQIIDRMGIRVQVLSSFPKK